MRFAVPARNAHGRVKGRPDALRFRANRDGSVVRCLQLAHNERHPQTGNPVAKVIHSFGRVEQVDRAAQGRPVSSISRFLTPEEAAAAAWGMEVEVVDSRRLGGRWTFDRIWERLEIGAAIRRAATGRRLDGAATERVVFALVAQRALEPGSKLAATKWAAERVAVEGCEGFTDGSSWIARRSRRNSGWTASTCCPPPTPALSAEDVALGYKNLLEAERGFRDLKSTLELRPVFTASNPASARTCCCAGWRCCSSASLIAAPA